MTKRSHPEKFKRSNSYSQTGYLKDKKLRRELTQVDKLAKNASQDASRSELLLSQEPGLIETEGDLEKTYKLSQAYIRDSADVGIAANSSSFDLPHYGPYKCRYSRSGREMILSGERGHIAVIDWISLKVKVELNLRETIHDATFLHNNQLFAVAQKRYAYIYDHSGAEVHVLRSHVEPLALEFLPYHFLLASVGTAGFLKYQDVSTGDLVAEHRTKLGSCSVLRQNPWNAVLLCGHGSGAVTMWTPNLSQPVVKMACHKGPVSALAVDAGGTYFVSAGLDGRVKVWDVRMFRAVHDYFSVVPAHAIDISQRGLVGVGFGSHVQIWGRNFALEESQVSSTSSLYDRSASVGMSLHQDRLKNLGKGIVTREPMSYMSSLRESANELGVTKARSPYLKHELPGRNIISLRFRPFDDVCAVGHSKGVSSMIVPGAGEPNFDALEINPFEGKKARREAEVKALLDKLPSTMISLDPTVIGAIDSAGVEIKERESKERAETVESKRRADAVFERQKGKRRGIRKALKKNANIVTEARVALLEKLKEEKKAKENEKKNVGGARGGISIATTSSEIPQSALSRFFKKEG